MLELAGKLKIQQLQDILAEQWKPYIQNLAFRKQRKHSKSQTRKMTRRLLELLGKILKEIRKPERGYENAQSLLTSREKSDLEIITKMYRQQKNHFHSKDRKENKGKDLVRKELARVRATAMEGSFGTQKEHYDLRRVKARTKLTEILYIFFGIHTANVVQLADRIEQRAQLAAS